MAADLTSPAVQDALGRAGRGLYVDQPDLTEQLDERSRLSEIGSYAPSVAVACQLVGIFGEAPIPLSAKDQEPLGPPLTTMGAIADHFSEWPRSALGLRTGPRGSWSLVGVQFANTAALLGWITETCGVTEEYRDSGNALATRGRYREYGRPGAVVWKLPDRPSILVSDVLRGADPNYRRAGQLLRDRRPPDRGGHLLVRVPLDGRDRPRFSGRHLGSGLNVLADSSIVPVSQTAEGGWVLDLIGYPQSPGDASPAWFAEALGGR